jgi:hypothetical protein
MNCADRATSEADETAVRDQWHRSVWRDASDVVIDDMEAGSRHRQVDRPAGAKAGVVGASSATQSPDTTTIGPVAAPACKTAVDRANTMLASAVRLQRELAEYSRLMSDPATRNLSGREVVEQIAPSLQAGASESTRFDQALADYRQIVDQCQLRIP